MDTFTINITNSKHNLKVGNYIDLINKKYGIESFADQSKTISNEVITSIGNRVEKEFMLTINKLFFLIIFFSILIFSSPLHINNFRIDASSDTLVAQNDEDFKFFNNYQKIFPTKNSLVVAIKSKNILNLEILNEIERISNKISTISEIDSVFNINKAPILFLNNTNLIDLTNQNYETILNTKYEIDEVLEEFRK